MTCHYIHGLVHLEASFAIDGYSTETHNWSRCREEKAVKCSSLNETSVSQWPLPRLSVAAHITQRFCDSVHNTYINSSQSRSQHGEKKWAQYWQWIAATRGRSATLQWKPTHPRVWQQKSDSMIPF